jgi:hypothetical protein
MDEVPTWSKKVQDWMDRMDIRSQRRIDVGFILTTYTRMCMSMYIYILVGGFNPSEIISKLGWLFRSKPPTSYGWHVFHHPFPFS